MRSKMGIGPKESSLLSKIKLKSISEMTDDELREFISADRTRRSQQRALGRAKRLIHTKGPSKKRSSRITLESIGLRPRLLQKLRATGRTDPEIIDLLREKGVI